MSYESRDYFVRLEGTEDLFPAAADAPIRAAQAFSIDLELEEGSVVEVKSVGGTFRSYRVGANPRVLQTLGSDRSGVTVR